MRDKMQMKNILPFGKPIISYEPVVDHMTGIIASDFERLQCDFYNNFIDIEVCRDAADYENAKNWLNYRAFDFNKIPHDIVFDMNEDEIIKMICRWIDEKRYIMVYFNTYYVSEYTTYKHNYKDTQLDHYAMILGYDIEKSVFLCGDFFDFTYYSVKPCSMTEVVQAIVHNTQPDSWGFAKDFTLLRTDENMIPSFNINKVIASLNKLLAENNIYYKKKYGLYVFDYVCEMMKKGELRVGSNEFIRPVQFIYMHMKTMKLRVQYMQKLTGESCLEDVLTSIDSKMLVIEQYRNYLLKLNIKRAQVIPEKQKEEFSELIRTAKYGYALDIQKIQRVLQGIRL